MGRSAARQAAVVADSRAMAGPLAERLRSRVRVLPHSIDTCRFATIPPRDVARRALGLALEARVVGSAGALFSAKGMHRLVRAVAELAEPGLVLAIAGEGPERPRLAIEAHESGIDLRLLGWLEDLRLALAAFDVFALASESEGLPSVVLQAMAARVPVVAVGAGGVAEALGGHGFLVPPGDETALAAALRRALDGALTPRLGPAEARVRRRFDARRLARRVAALHLEVLGTDAGSEPGRRARLPEGAPEGGD